jgi:hypothetical protein
MRLLRRALLLPTLAPTPPGITPDPAADFGFFQLRTNTNTYCGHLEVIATSGTSVTLTAAQTRRNVIRFTTGASGGYAINLPATSAILSAWNQGNQVLVTDGTFGKYFAIMNDGVGQVGTLTAGDASTTITGTATIANNVTRWYFVMVTSATTLTYFNIGTLTV